mmetsp:Transcript_17464/g.59956  ORF Transcript_17464/g.59956 Transcript_17464/m.59956 type:complete len:184 (-) Transcript_17464:67-618(-)
MFKRFTMEEVSSQSQVKSSVGRGIKASILEIYPEIDGVLEEILPKKADMSLAKCTNHISILAINKTPLFFQCRDGPWYPTLRLVHKYPDAFTTNAWRTDGGAIRFVLSGANVMSPGFTHEDGEMATDIAVDAPVIITAFGKRHAMAVGQVKMSRDAISGTNTGIAVENLHFCNDGLWQLTLLD